MKPFYVFTGLVLLWAAKMWASLPIWMHLLVVFNVMLAGALTTLKVFRALTR